MRQARRIEAALLRGDHHPARRLVPAGWTAVLRVVLRREVERHAEILAPALELERVIAAPRLGPRAQRNAAGARHDRLEVERLQDQLHSMAANDVLLARPGEIRPWRGQAVVAGNFDHRIAMI